jgi:sulfatase maturation enzyme AslB (radical SAM superfamily)
MIKYKRINVGPCCNNNCLYCPTANEQPDPTLSEIVAQMTAGKFYDSAELVGGEPTLRPDIFEIIGQARKAGFRRIKMVTNARAFADINMAAKTIEAGCHLFEIKVHHHVPAIHDQVTQVAGSLAQTVEGITNLRYVDEVDDETLRAFLHLVIPISRHNFENIGDVALAFIPYDIDRITLSFDDHDLEMHRALPHVQNAINASILNRVWMTTRRIPLCAMTDFEYHVAEIYDPPDKGFEKDKQCEECVYSDACPGISGTYAERFGFSDLKPLSKSKHAEDIRRLQHGDA